MIEKLLPSSSAIALNPAVLDKFFFATRACKLFQIHHLNADEGFSCTFNCAFYTDEQIFVVEMQKTTASKKDDDDEEGEGEKKEDEDKEEDKPTGFAEAAGINDDEEEIEGNQGWEQVEAIENDDRYPDPAFAELIPDPEDKHKDDDSESDVGNADSEDNGGNSYSGSLGVPLKIRGADKSKTVQDKSNKPQVLTNFQMYKRSGSRRRINTETTTIGGGSPNSASWSPPDTPV